MPTVARLTAVIEANTTGFDKGVASAEAKLKNLGSESTRTGKAAAGMGQDFEEAGTVGAKAAGRVAEGVRGTHDAVGKLLASGMIAQIGQSISGLGQQAARMFAGAVASSMDYEKVMSTVKAVSGATAAEMAKLGAQSMKLGKDTVFSAKEAASAQAELLKGNVSLSDVLGGALKGTLSLASAGEMDVAKAAGVAANAMNQFGLKGSQVSHVADVLATAANKSTGEVSDFAIGLGQAGAAAHTAGLNIDQTAAVLALFANKGLQASDAGTSLKTFLEFTVPKSKAAGDAMKALGLSFFDTAGHMRPIAGIAQQLQDKMAGLSQQQRMTALNTIFGSDASRAATILMEAGAKGVTNMTAAVGKKGEADRIAAEKQNNLAGAVENFKGSVETAGIAIGTALTPAISAVTNGIKAVVDRFNDLPAPVQKFAAIAGAAAAASLVIGGGLISAAASVAGLAASLAAMGITAGGAVAAIGAIALPVAAVVAGVALLALAWKNDFGGIREVAAKVSAEVAGFVQKNFGYVQKWFTQNMPLIRETVRTILTAIEQFWAAHGSRIMAIIRPMWDIIKTVFSAALHIVLATVKLAMDVITGHWGAAAKDVGVIVTNLWAVVRSLFQNGVKIIGNALALVVEAAVDFGNHLFDAMLSAGQQAINGIVGGLKSGIGTVAKAATDLGHSITGGVHTALDIHSPSRVMYNAGVMSALGLVLGLAAGVPAVANAGDLLGQTVHRHVKVGLTESQKEMSAYVKEMAKQQAILAALRRGDTGAAAGVAGQYHAVPNAALANIKAQIAQIKAAAAEQARFNAELAKSKAQLKELLAGGSRRQATAAGKYADIPEAKRDQLAGIQDQVALLKGLPSAMGKIGEAGPKAFGDAFSKAIKKANDKIAKDAKTAQDKLNFTAQVIKNFDAEMTARTNAAQMVIDGTEDPTAKAWQDYLSTHGALADAISKDAKKAAVEFGKFKTALEIDKTAAGLTHTRDMLSDIARRAAELAAKNPFEAWKASLSVPDGRGGVKTQDGVTDADLHKVFDAQVLEAQKERSLAIVGQFVSGLQNTVSGALDGLFQNGFQGFFSNVVSGFQKMFADIAKQMLMNEAMTALLGALGGMNLQAQFGFGSLAGARAAGGPITGGLPYVVGEKGPEVIVPHSSGTVIPNHQIKAAGGAGGGQGGDTHNHYNTISVTVQSSGGDTRQDRRSGQQIAEAAFAEMMHAYRKGGNY